MNLSKLYLLTLIPLTMFCLSKASEGPPPGFQTQAEGTFTAFDANGTRLRVVQHPEFDGDMPPADEIQQAIDLAIGDENSEFRDSIEAGHHIIAVNCAEDGTIEVSNYDGVVEGVEQPEPFTATILPDPARPEALMDEPMPDTNASTRNEYHTEPKTVEDYLRWRNGDMRKEWVNGRGNYRHLQWGNLDEKYYPRDFRNKNTAPKNGTYGWYRLAGKTNSTKPDYVPYEKRPDTWKLGQLLAKGSPLNGAILNAAAHPDNDPNREATTGRPGRETFKAQVDRYNRNHPVGELTTEVAPGLPAVPLPNAFDTSRNRRPLRGLQRFHNGLHFEDFSMDYTDWLNRIPFAGKDNAIKTIQRFADVWLDTVDNSGELRPGDNHPRNLSDPETVRDRIQKPDKKHGVITRNETPVEDVTELFEELGIQARYRRQWRTAQRVQDDDGTSVGAGGIDYAMVPKTAIDYEDLKTNLDNDQKLSDANIAFKIANTVPMRSRVNRMTPRGRAAEKRGAIHSLLHRENRGRSSPRDGVIRRRFFDTEFNDGRRMTRSAHYMEHTFTSDASTRSNRRSAESGQNILAAVLGAIQPNRRIRDTQSYRQNASEARRANAREMQRTDPEMYERLYGQPEKIHNLSVKQRAREIERKNAIKYLKSVASPSDWNTSELETIMDSAAYCDGARKFMASDQATALPGSEMQRATAMLKEIDEVQVGNICPARTVKTDSNDFNTDPTRLGNDYIDGITKWAKAYITMRKREGQTGRVKDAEKLAKKEAEAKEERELQEKIKMAEMAEARLTNQSNGGDSKRLVAAEPKRAKVEASSPEQSVEYYLKNASGDESVSPHPDHDVSMAAKQIATVLANLSKMNKVGTRAQVAKMLLSTITQGKMTYAQFVPKTEAATGTKRASSPVESVEYYLKNVSGDGSVSPQADFNPKNVEAVIKAYQSLKKDVDRKAAAGMLLKKPEMFVKLAA